MRTIDYSQYYWQDDKVRLRAFEEENWENCYTGGFDTPARILLECAVELPPTITGAKRFIDQNVAFSSTNGHIMFTTLKS
ncbi:hypothetical protein SAMN05720606_109133 [Paenibacillus polysaccharolyticus]|uniref:Uncharacterized protein n=1 Tax=Paenibacillus polysaccharolyticus TaxID=582692 RepID=A0A1G5IT92_9BACL|nr:hypothetical protein [Paenibacillus polysaccharolyticus]SCY78931.1 hypothetical protein SAMN05720606_109133 [Paenibacillus polysaccharolyticus]